jgi:hypothetical protein
MLMISCLTVWPVGRMDCGTARVSAAGSAERRARRRMVDDVRVGLMMCLVGDGDVWKGLFMLSRYAATRQSRCRGRYSLV